MTISHSKIHVQLPVSRRVRWTFDVDHVTMTETRSEFRVFVNVQTTTVCLEPLQLFVPYIRYLRTELGEFFALDTTLNCDLKPMRTECAQGPSLTRDGGFSVDPAANEHSPVG